MNETFQGRRSLPVWEAAGLILLFLTVGVFGAALSAVAVQRLGLPFLAEIGPDRIMRRCLMGWAALFIAAVLWRGGWRGWRDCGFTPADPADSGRPWWGLVLPGIGVGLITLGSLSLLTLLLGQRVVTPVATAEEGVRRAVSFIGSGIAVALIEETVCRGMLFRVLARAWTIWPAAILTSLLFALAHFLNPDPLSFKGANFLQTGGNVFISTYVQAARVPAAPLVFANLALLGMVFCGFVVRTGTIWLAIGTHAAWVWAIKFFHLWTAVAPGIQAGGWLGLRSDFLDSPVVSGLLILLIAWGFVRPRRAGMVVRHEGFAWRVAPGEADALRKWLDRYESLNHEIIKLPSLEGQGVGRFKGGIVLKDHDGSVVKALGGWVVKSYRPKNARAAWHFAIRPSRARRAFLLGRELRDLGIPTPPPVAWQVRRRAGLLQSEIFIMAEAPAAETMSDWLKRDVREPALRARVMAAYGRLLAQFHRRGYSNRDMKHSNIMCGRAEPWQLQVVDLDGVRHWPWLGRRRAGRDLMRVGQSLASLGWTGPAEVRAFFEAYNAEAPARLRRDAFPPERK